MSKRRRSASPPRWVLDTNVVLSALVFNSGVAGQMRSAWQQGVCLPLISTATAHELIRVLAYPKFKLSADEQAELLADYLPYAEVVQIGDPPPVTPPCRDRFDQPFLQLAIAGRADRLVSGDKDLLVLADRFEVPIVSVEEALMSSSIV